LREVQLLAVHRAGPGVGLEEEGSAVPGPDVRPGHLRTTQLGAVRNLGERTPHGRNPSAVGCSAVQPAAGRRLLLNCRLVDILHPTTPSTVRTAAWQTRPTSSEPPARRSAGAMGASPVCTRP